MMTEHPFTDLPILYWLIVTERLGVWNVLKSGALDYFARQGEGLAS